MNTNVYKKGKSKEVLREKGRHAWSKVDDDNLCHHTKMDFPRFERGDPRGWILKAEKYSCYYQTLEKLKVEIAAMYLEGGALDLFAWITSKHTLMYWEELNPDQYLCNIKQTGSIQEYRQEFTKRVAPVKQWPEHCLLGVFLKFHKPMTIKFHRLPIRRVLDHTILLPDYKIRQIHGRLKNKIVWLKGLYFERNEKFALANILLPHRVSRRRRAQ
ncbi:hypothetical protein CDL12_22542 [Handroanthus impetiginosus]|uniref:Retrotransposon gag domain-containing protein n=1 Tax=Handroanthus impetiginosus TaxID=429701 RepID=A0A2G9GI03_9LAMI|nr:hypothetical protein CDL12_22542 [Handroanthus impetiginosus]